MAREKKYPATDRVFSVDLREVALFFFPTRRPIKELSSLIREPAHLCCVAYVV
jgi:hypothetical protein